MDEVENVVSQALTANGGSVLYPSLLENLDGYQRSLLPRVLRKMRDEGTISKSVGRNAETGELEHRITALG